MEVVKQNSPTIMQGGMGAYIAEYETRATPEALFVRAIDKFEPLVQLLHEQGRVILQRERCTIENSRSIKDEHVKHFPSIKHFTETLHQYMIAEGYFYIAQKITC